ncbi:DUF4124 domain-containing protein [Ottowia thiooxydans]|uniref:DUF4124 domain-containing protein n=1 Tax=Ottowia thiooxydans TaxID=219182 RepID=UPI0004906CDF|nr:DUF4124 domain-containing protein [Ottowia thiooxydans]
MNFARIFTVCMLLIAASTASAQYQWVDKDGRKIYSDRAPPADVPQKSILKEPRGASRTAPRAAPESAASSTAPSAPATAPAASPAPSGTDKALEEKKKQAEAAEAAKKKEEEQKVTAQRAENCKRALAAKAGLDSGIRIARTNDKGEREFLDDAARAAEQQRTQAVIQADCK